MAGVEFLLVPHCVDLLTVPEQSFCLGQAGLGALLVSGLTLLSLVAILDRFPGHAIVAEGSMFTRNGAGQMPLGRGRQHLTATLSFFGGGLVVLGLLDEDTVLAAGLARFFQQALPLLDLSVSLLLQGPAGGLTVPAVLHLPTADHVMLALMNQLMPAAALSFGPLERFHGPLTKFGSAGFHAGGGGQQLLGPQGALGGLTAILGGLLGEDRGEFLVLLGQTTVFLGLQGSLSRVPQGGVSGATLGQAFGKEALGLVFESLGFSLVLPTLTKGSQEGRLPTF